MFHVLRAVMFTTPVVITLVDTVGYIARVDGKQFRYEICIKCFSLLNLPNCRNIDAASTESKRWIGRLCVLIKMGC